MINGVDVSKKDSLIEKVVSDSIKDLIEMIKNITEFNQNELKSLSMIQSIEPLEKLMHFYVINKKHLKRKHSMEVLRALKYVANAVSGLSNDDDKGFLSRIFSKKE